ncbi:6555_t:CDS:10 [Diversispora eburnea]|uniref:6555_t:CDS:1 n=1 Tax=Diversispora eburnea TaxID=1213867 RepID=A0A9N8V4C6_9GLOM|nr:6555_t:CDS:10 [Diversispora eburnea]
MVRLSNESLKNQLKQTSKTNATNINNNINVNFEVVKAVDKVPMSHTLKKELKESRMPTTRISRLFHYGGLAVSLGIGTVGETVRRATGISNEKGSSVMSEANIDRLVNKLSRMRGAALKLGQMLSIQDNVLTSQIENLLLRVQNSADYMPNSQMERVLIHELGPNWKNNFLNFDPIPMAAASIGQVHSAQLASSGMPIAIKIQYPGVATSINSDLNNLKILVKVSNLFPKGLYLDNTIKVARKELIWETDYIREAECMKKFYDLLKDDNNFVVPQVIKEYSTKMILTSERVMGEPLINAVNYSQELRNQIGKNILQLCLRELFEFKFMQTDPNWSNFFYNKTTNKIELVDFGASRSFDDRFVNYYFQILKSAAEQNVEGCAIYSKKIGYLTGYESEVMHNAHIDSILTLGKPFSVPVYDFSKQTITSKIRDLIPTMLKYRLTPPPDETYSIHRKLSGAFLLCAKLGAKIRCRDIFEDIVGIWMHGKKDMRTSIQYPFYTLSFSFKECSVLFVKLKLNQKQQRLFSVSLNKILQEEIVNTVQKVPEVLNNGQIKNSSTIKPKDITSTCSFVAENEEKEQTTVVVLFVQKFLPNPLPGRIRSLLQLKFQIKIIHLQMKIAKEKKIAPWQYWEEIMVPETALCLISQDKGNITLEEARKIMENNNTFAPFHFKWVIYEEKNDGIVDKKPTNSSKESAEAHGLVTPICSEKLFVMDLPAIKQIYEYTKIRIKKLKQKDDEADYIANSEEVFRLRGVTNVRSVLEYIRG